MKIKWPKIKFYSQVQLIELKKKLATQINNIETAIKKANETNNVDELLENIEYRSKLAKDLKKVKIKIAKKNVDRSINELIYGREEIGRELEFLKLLSKNKHKRVAFFKKLKGVNFNIESIIEGLQNKFQKITDIQNRKNNSFFSKSLLILTSQ